MSDHDFEKRVKQKMDELRFRPSDAVWTGLERELRKSRPSRRGWLYMPMLLLLLGLTGYFAFDYYDKPVKGLAKTSSTENETVSGKSKTLNNDGDNSTLTNPSASDSSQKKPAGTEASISKSSGNRNRPGSVPESGLFRKKVVATNKLNGNSKAFRKPGNKTASGSGSRKSSVKNGQKISPEENDLVTDKSKTIKKNTEVKVAEPDTDNNQGMIGDNTAASEGLTDKTSGDKPGDQKSADGALVISVQSKADSAKDVALNQLKNTDSNQAATITKAQVKVKSKAGKFKWEWGVTASAGVSKLGDGNGVGKAFRTTSNADAALASAPNYNNLFAPITTGIPPPKASEVKAGFHFTAGGFVRKQFTNRLSVSAGLQYSQYNNTIQIGYRVDSARLVNSGSQVMNVSRFYRADQSSKFSNKYHFIELPLYIHLQLNKSKVMPLFWNFGVTVSQMFGNDALVFDSGTGVYYKDESFYHHTQFAVGTGFSVGVFSKSRTPLWIGPSVKYQVTQLFNKEISGEKHLMSASLDLRLFLNKK